ncbi:hypothetical protein MMC12_005584 [Toensbergia leucococca]|nr:hypothetical protein [Toensbergia leucococca]
MARNSQLTEEEEEAFFAQKEDERIAQKKEESRARKAHDQAIASLLPIDSEQKSKIAEVLRLWPGQYERWTCKGPGRFGGGYLYLTDIMENYQPGHWIWGEKEECAVWVCDRPATVPRPLLR